MVIIHTCLLSRISYFDGHTSTKYIVMVGTVRSSSHAQLNHSLAKARPTMPCIPLVMYTHANARYGTVRRVLRVQLRWPWPAGPGRARRAGYSRPSRGARIPAPRADTRMHAHFCFARPVSEFVVLNFEIFASLKSGVRYLWWPTGALRSADKRFGRQCSADTAAAPGSADKRFGRMSAAL